MNPDETHRYRQAWAEKNSWRGRRPPHTQDSDCSINPATNTCTVCGVLHGDPCPVCGGRGFHKPDCAPPSVAGYYMLQGKDPRKNVPIERIERAIELWYEKHGTVPEDFWRIPARSIRYWLDRAEEDERKLTK